MNTTTSPLKLTSAGHMLLGALLALIVTVWAYNANHPYVYLVGLLVTGNLMLWGAEAAHRHGKWGK